MIECKHCNVEIPLPFDYCRYCAHTELARKEAKLEELEAENKKLRDALDNLREECTNEGGHPEDYINALKKADAALLEVDNGAS